MWFTTLQVCALYLDTNPTFTISNGETWHFKYYFDCHVNNIIYFLTCYFCKHSTYIGKTWGDKIMNRGFKTRINKHISDSRTGQGTCVFAKHVFNCAKNSNKSLAEPFFKINIMMVLKTPLLLETMTQ